MNFREELKSKTAAVEKIVESYLPEESGTQHEIMEAMNYSVTAGGKRLRPLLMQETYRMFGGEGREVEPFMAAMEMIHTYSLVHDDLPAMDNDEYRRGKLTTHAKFGHAMGVLAGDALLNYAFETAAEAFDKSTDLQPHGKGTADSVQKGRNLWYDRRTGGGCTVLRTCHRPGQAGFYLRAEDRSASGGGHDGGSCAGRSF